jgi:divinyl protochlorophyllide a 8-vinyl-reductase
MSDSPPRRVENSIMRLALTSTELTLGKSGYYAVLHVAGLDAYAETPPPDSHAVEIPGEHFAALFNGIFTIYGESPARGLFRRWGTVFGTTAMKRRPSAALLQPLLKVLPIQRRVRTILDAVIAESNQTRGAPLHTLQDAIDHYIVTFRDCLYCDGLQPSEPICYAIIGMLEAALKWGTGRDFAVNEAQCHARGAEACIFEIAKQPLHV